MSAEQNARHYYQKFFPAWALHRWASREWVDGGPRACKREWGWEGWHGQPFMRWKACDTPSQLRELASADGVGKINLGAMYEHSPRDRYKIQVPMEPVAREFVIDIDLTDYWGGTNDLESCDQMWPLVALGLEVIRRILHEHFGFQHILPVYSGRRGGHLWVCDRRASELTKEQREAIVKFMSPIEDGKKKAWAWLLKHPGFSEISRTLVLPFMRTHAIKPTDQSGLGLFDTAFQRRLFCERIHVDVLRDIGDSVGQSASPQGALDVIEGYVRRSRIPLISERYEEAVWQSIGPNIDVAVSSDTRHTLKIPFSVHPKTGRISVPILNDTLEKFPVKKRSPTVNDLASDDDRGKRARKTLSITVENFNLFVKRLSESDTEKREPVLLGDLPPVPKRQIVYDMRGDLAAPRDSVGSVPITCHADRVCWVTTRVFSIIADEEVAGCFVVRMRTVSAYGRDDDTTRMCKKDCYPPWPYHGRERLDEEVIDHMWDVVSTHADDACELHLHSSDRVVMLLNCATVHEGAKKWSRMSERLSECIEICKINLDWGESGVKSMFRQHVLPYCESLGSL